MGGRTTEAWLCAVAVPGAVKHTARAAAATINPARWLFISIETPEKKRSITIRSNELFIRDRLGSLETTSGQTLGAQVPELHMTIAEQSEPDEAVRERRIVDGLRELAVNPQRDLPTIALY